MSDDINREIVIELRKTRRALYAVLLVFALSLLPAFYSAFRHQTTPVDNWERVTAAMRRQDFAAALSMAQTLTASQPNYYYGHAYLGVIHLAMGDVTNALAEYSRAYELFPNEETEKELGAVRKRLNGGPGFKLMSQ